MHEQHSSHSAIPPGAVHGNDPPRPRTGPRHREGRPGRVEGQGRRPGPEAPLSHATSLLAWPLLTILAYQSHPLAVLFIVVFLAMFVLYVMAMIRVQRILNERGESLVYPWRVPSAKREARRVDGVLSTSIRRLKSGEDEAEVLATLRLHLEGRLTGEAGRHYERAVEGLQDAMGRHWVFDRDRRESALEEAEKELWMTRAEYLKEMME